MPDMLLFSSGNPLADRRLAMAQAFQVDHDIDAARDLVAQALDLAPDWAAAWFLQGELCQTAGDLPAAEMAFRRCLGLDPEDALGSLLRLALLGAALLPDKAPEAYVRTLFDQYAPRFDQALLARLAYRGPEQLGSAVSAVAGHSADSGAPSTASSGFSRCLDLGCGTGLTGAVFRPRAAWLEGVDLSPGMIREARRKKLYDALHEAEITAFLQTVARSFDLVVAGDVLSYLGELTPLFQAVAPILAPGGLFAFTVQSGSEDGPDIRLGADQRFSHRANYIARVAAACGLAVRHSKSVFCRCEAGRPVPSLVIVCGRTEDDPRRGSHLAPQRPPDEPEGMEPMPTL